VKLRLVTSVWGSWHLDRLVRVAIPMLLAPGNLPALAAEARTCWRIRTTPNGKAWLDSHPAVRAAAEVCDLETIVASETEDPSTWNHIGWWHLDLEAAAAAGEAVVTMHPDVAWSDGSLLYLSKAFDRGKKAVLGQSIRVIDETIVPALLDRSAPGVNSEFSPIAIPSRDLVQLALTHLHPLQVAASDIGHAARPSNEINISAGAAGYVMILATRPAIAVNPQFAAVGRTFFLNEAGDDIDFGTDLDQHVMLSLPSLYKDIGRTRPGSVMDPTEVALWSSDEFNESPISGQLLSSRVLLCSDVTSDAVSTALKKADQAARRIINTRAWIRLARRVEKAGFPEAAGWIGRGVFDGSLQQRSLPDGPVTFFWWPNFPKSAAGSPAEAAENADAVLRLIVPQKVEKAGEYTSLSGQTVDFAPGDQAFANGNKAQVIPVGEALIIVVLTTDSA
jgi:hypothetical protein